MALLPPIQRVALVMCGSFNPITNMHLRMFELARDALRNAGFDPVIGFISPVSDGYKKRDLASAEHRCNIIRESLKPDTWIHLDTWECSQSNWMPTRDVLEHFQLKLDVWYENHGQNDEEAEPINAKKPRIDPVNAMNDIIPKNVTSSFQKPASTDNGQTATSQQFSDRQQRGLAAMYEEEFHRRSPSPPAMRIGPRHILKATDSFFNPGVRVMFLCGADLFESFAVPNLWADEDIGTIAGRFGIVCINRYGSNADRLIYESDMLNINRHNIFIVTDWIVNEISSTKVRRALRRGESVRYLLQDGVIDYIYKHNLYGSTPPLGDRVMPHSFAKHFPALVSDNNGSKNCVYSQDLSEDKTS